MKKTYQRPNIEVIEIEVQSLLAQSAPLSYKTTSFRIDETETIEYKGIYNDTFSGGFLDTK